MPTAQRWAGPGGWLPAALNGAVVVQLVLRNLDLDGPPARPDLWWTAGPVAVPAAVVLAVVAWWAMGPDPQFPPATDGPGPQAPRLQLGEGERAVWTRSVISRRAIFLTCVYVAGAVLAAFSDVSRYIPEMIFGFMAVTTVAQAWVRVRVDEHGVRVIQPLLRRSLVGVELRSLVEARADTLSASQLPMGAYGAIHTASAFGYRARAGGEILRLTTATERDFVVTVPDAATAAALVNAELDRRRTGADHPRC